MQFNATPGGRDLTGYGKCHEFYLASLRLPSIHGDSSLPSPRDAHYQMLARLPKGGWLDGELPGCRLGGEQMNQQGHLHIP